MLFIHVVDPTSESTHIAEQLWNNIQIFFWAACDKQSKNAVLFLLTQGVSQTFDFAGVLE